jgi:hypothetical protein
MTNFFDQLVNDRREGIAPPQVEHLRQVAPPEVTFWELCDPPNPALWECSRCFALVTGSSSANHADWHYLTGT